MTSFPSDRPTSTYDFREEIAVLEHAIDLVERPLPGDLPQDAPLRACVGFVRQGVFFILTMANESLNYPERLQSNSWMAEHVWDTIEPLLDMLDRMYQSFDERRAMSN